MNQPMTRPVATTPVRLDRQSLEHAARAAIGATVALLVARLFKLPESYWAAITTMIVLESTLGAALSVSALRLIGTAFGAVAGGLLASYFGPQFYIFGAGVFLLGVLTAALHLDHSAFRFAGITLAIVMLGVHTQSPWIVAGHRFVEVSIGIVIGLLLTAVWPQRQAP
jgi:uncharacterized membrane protein YccC